MYDAIIVGARCAGSPLAMLLARQGHKVLLLDRASFPSDTISTHGLKPPATARLKKWGLLDAVLASNCPPIPAQQLDFGPLVLKGTSPGVDGVRFLVAPRRYVLDEILVRAAVDAGAELREDFTVDDVVVEDGVVVGVRGHGRGGARITERARIVVGADGRHSTIAKAVGAQTTVDRGAFCCAYYSYFSGLDVENVELYLRPNRFAIVFPTNDDKAVVMVEWPRDEFHAFRADIEGNFYATLELAPALAERARAGTREERFTGTVDLPNFQRKAYGPGWALAGDALSHKDPILAQGTSDAFHDAAFLADAIHAGLSGAQPMEAALAEYERRHTEASLALFEMTCEFATLQPPPPEMQHLLASIVGDQQAIDQFIGTADGTTPLAEFYAPENIARLTGVAA